MSASRSGTCPGRAGGGGQGGARALAALQPRRMGAGDRPARPGRRARGPGGGSSRRSRPAALRPDARLRVHLLSRRRRDHGRRPRARRRDSGLWVQACGDAHLSNFGAYAAPDRSLVVDINDFDETLPGPWEWDVKRLAASFEIGGRDRGFTDKQRREVVLAATRAYRENMRSLAGAQQSRRLVPARQRRSDPRSVCASGQQGGAAQVRAQRRQDPAQGPDAGDVEADRTGRRGAADQNRSAGARAVRADLLGQAAREGRGGPRHGAGGVSRDPPPRPSPPARRLPARAHGSQGGRRRQRRNPGLGRAVRRSRRGGPALSPGQGGPAVRARALHGIDRVRASRASASSRASG